MNIKSNAGIGLFGGSFDPVHNGHIQLAELALQEFKLEKVIFIPAGVPPHKLSKELAPASKRLEMLQIALHGREDFQVSDFELEKNHSTYTYQTVGHFKNLFPVHEIYFILGMDSLVELKTWKNYKYILKMCQLIIGKRHGTLTGDFKLESGSMHFISQPIVNVSSSMIRNMTDSGQSINGLAPHKVAEYIKSHCMYGYTGRTNNLK